MKKLFVLALFFSFISDFNAQTWTWDSLIYQNAGREVSRDLTYGVYSYRDSVIEKLHPHGGKIWQMILPGQLSVRKVISSSDGSYFAAGIFSNTCIFGSDTITSKGGQDIWLARFSTNNNLLWIKSAGSSQLDNFGDLCMNGTDVAMIGSLGDTSVFFSQSINKRKCTDFFLAKITSAGGLQNIKLATALPTSTLPGYSTGYNCGTDQYGNIYVLLHASGASVLDTFQLATSNSMYSGFSQVIKFNAALQPQWRYNFGGCYMFCTGYSALKVNSNGVCYLLSFYSYNQSGADIESSSIIMISAIGTLGGTYGLPPNRAGQYHSIDLDASDNLYYTGYYRRHSYPVCYTTPALCKAYFVTGKLNPNLSPDWQKIDSATTYRCGYRILSLAPNDTYVVGAFTGSITLYNSLTASLNPNTSQQYFHGRMNTLNPSSIKETADDELKIFPCPATDKLTIKEGTGGTIQISDVSGKILLSQKISESPHVLDISAFQSGLYFCKWRGAKEEKVVKVVKE